MINKRELRIGNLVKVNYIFQVKEIKQDGINRIWEEFWQHYS